MPSGKNTTAGSSADLTLRWLLTNGAATRPTTWNIALLDTLTEPTTTSAGTEITGTGYSAGGPTIDFAAASGGSTSGPTSGGVGAITLTNGSGAQWDIGGINVHSGGATLTAAATLYWADSTALGGDVVVPNGADLVIPVDGITITEA